MTLLRRAAVWSSLVLLAGSSVAIGQGGQMAAADTSSLMALWDTARAGDLGKLDTQLGKLEQAKAHDPDAKLVSIADAASSLTAHIAQREKDRAARITEVRADIDKALAT